MISYEIRASLPDGSVYVVGWRPTKEEAQVVLADVLRLGPWQQPATIEEIEIPDLIEFGPRSTNMTG